MTDHNSPWVDAELERDRQEREYENELWDEHVRHVEEQERERVEEHE